MQIKIKVKYKNGNIWMILFILNNILEYFYDIICDTILLMLYIVLQLQSLDTSLCVLRNFTCFLTLPHLTLQLYFLLLFLTYLLLMRYTLSPVVL